MNRRLSAVDQEDMQGVVLPITDGTIGMIDTVETRLGSVEERVSMV